MVAETQPEERQAQELGPALLLAAVLSLLVLLRMWSAEDPPLGVGDAKVPEQRLTPTEAPRFKAGRWVDEDGRPLRGGVGR